jgi:hypothetical protein
MSLGQQLVQDVMQMGGAEMPLLLNASQLGRTAAASISQWSPLAVAVDMVNVSGGAPIGDLRQHAENLALRLNYLNEPIAVVEIDAVASSAQLRSSRPKPLTSAIEYFEVLVAKDGAASIFRYHHPVAQSRTEVPFTLTLETLARLVDDLSGPVSA